MSTAAAVTTPRAAIAVAVAALTLASAAPAKAPAPIVKARKVAARTLVVTAKGLTLYRLSGESATNIKCTGSCVGVWPPLTVPSKSTKLVAGKGVAGKLAVVKRPVGDGRFQVTLRGRPLYRFVGDSSPGTTSGEGLKSFGGTWGVLKAK